MPLEGLVVDKLCFCIPKRKGLLVYGCLYLIIQLFMTGLFIDELGDPDPRLQRGFGGFDLLLTLINVIFSIVLMYGSHKRNPDCLKLFFWYQVVSIVLGILLDLTVFYLYGMFVHKFLMLVNFSIYPFYMYLLVVVRSSYLKMELDYPINYMAQPDE